MTIDWLDDEALGLMSLGHCPKCSHRGFVLGPRGAGAQNIECASIPCRARFNITLSPIGPPGVIVLAHEIDRESAGGVGWSNSPGWERG